MPQLSVLMPVYNAEKFLAEAIDSILAQTFTDFEFLIIDDGSTDNSLNIIRAYADKRIRLIRNEKNLGISATLNKGIRLAASDLIARMDADDIAYPDRLEKQYQFTQEHPDGALYTCWVRQVTEDRQVIKTEPFRPPFYYYNQTFECWIYHPSMLYRKAAVQAVGGYTVPYAEDWELIWQLMRDYKHYHLPKVLLDYRITSQSLHQVAKKKEYDEAMEAIVRRNIHYYTGGAVNLTDPQLECLRYNIQPLLEIGSVQEVLHTLDLLSMITQAILDTPNPNRCPADIEGAAYAKRKYLIINFASHLAPHKAAYLLLKTGMLSLATKIIKIRLKQLIKNNT
ncbi:glycosyl transferase domain-containing protein [Flammeovirgaceae bacterium 311]|nr:glycosyl transferase domain-containing protein [Flammeovirgaceae bacterium 311]